MINFEHRKSIKDYEVANEQRRKTDYALKGTFQTAF